MHDFEDDSCEEEDVPVAGTQPVFNLAGPSVAFKPCMGALQQRELSTSLQGQVSRPQGPAAAALAPHAQDHPVLPQMEEEDEEEAGSNGSDVDADDLPSFSFLGAAGKRPSVPARTPPNTVSAQAHPRSSSTATGLTNNQALLQQPVAAAVINTGQGLDTGLFAVHAHAQQHNNQDEDLEDDWAGEPDSQVPNFRFMPSQTVLPAHTRQQPNAAHTSLPTAQHNTTAHWSAPVRAYTSLKLPAVTVDASPLAAGSLPVHPIKQEPGAQQAADPGPGPAQSTGMLRPGRPRAALHSIAIKQEQQQQQDQPIDEWGAGWAPDASTHSQHQQQQQQHSQPRQAPAQTAANNRYISAADEEEEDRMFDFLHHAPTGRPGSDTKRLNLPAVPHQPHHQPAWTAPAALHQPLTAAAAAGTHFTQHALHSPAAPPLTLTPRDQHMTRSKRQHQPFQRVSNQRGGDDDADDIISDSSDSEKPLQKRSAAGQQLPSSFGLHPASRVTPSAQMQGAGQEVAAQHGPGLHGLGAAERGGAPAGRPATSCPAHPSLAQLLTPTGVRARQTAAQAAAGRGDSATLRPASIHPTTSSRPQPEVFNRTAGGVAAPGASRGPTQATGGGGGTQVGRAGGWSVSLDPGSGIPTVSILDSDSDDDARAPAVSARASNPETAVPRQQRQQIQPAAGRLQQQTLALQPRPPAAGQQQQFGQRGQAQQQVQAGGCDDAGGQAGAVCWWQLLDDFVPVEVLETHGTDPRDGSFVHVAYRSQFAEDAAAVHQALLQRHNQQAAGGLDREDELLAAGGWKGGSRAGSGKTRRKSSSSKAGDVGDAGGAGSPAAGKWYTEADGKRVYVDASGQRLVGSAAYRTYKRTQGGGSSAKKRKGGRRRWKSKAGSKASGSKSKGRKLTVAQLNRG